MRSTLAVVAGILLALAVQAGADVLASLFYPYAITDMGDQRQYSEAFAARPTGALLLAVLGYFLGGLAGAAAAKLISRRSWTCWVPAGFLSLTAILLGLAYPLHTWAWMAMFAAPLLAAMIANHLIAGQAVEIEAEAPVPSPDPGEADARL